MDFIEVLIFTTHPCHPFFTPLLCPSAMLHFIPLRIAVGVIITEFGAALTMENPDDANCLKGLAQQLKTSGVMGAYHWHGWHNGEPRRNWNCWVVRDG